MAVYTEVSFHEAADFFQTLDLGQLQNLKACAGGIENTNYFADTDRGEYVLTLFERLSFEQLPFYLQLMKHLAERDILVPNPAPDQSGKILHSLKGKPAAVVNKLSGHSELAPNVAHCASVGAMLARLHLAGQDFELHQPNLRGLTWWNTTVHTILPHINDEQRRLLLSELAYQNHIAASSAYKALPTGTVHGDLFRDNVMFDGDKLTGFFDFYFAGCDTFLFDIGVCLNDWCIDHASDKHVAAQADAFLNAYQTVRPLTAQERALLPAMARAGALRFWISRLWDFYLPREATLLKAHDPSRFERVLAERVAHPFVLSTPDPIRTAGQRKTLATTS
jgi:homoserine kinase type II